MKTQTSNFYIQTKGFDNRLLTIITLIGIVFLISLCVFKSEPTVLKQSLIFPEINFRKILWLNNKLFAFSDNRFLDNPLQFLEQGSSIPKDLILPDDANCIYSTQYSIGNVFPDGRIQILKSCFTEPRTKTFLMAYDWETGKLEEFAGAVPLGSSEAYMNPNQSKGIVFLDSGFARKTLYSIWTGGFGPLDVVIKDSENSWNLSNYYPDLSETEDFRTGDAGRADWSPDGNLIAFFASSDAIGKTGSDRFYAEYKLYIMDANKLAPSPVLDNVHFPFIVKWSPDSKYIAFIGQYGDTKQDGFWLYSLGTDSITRIDKGSFQDILWDQNTSEKIYAIKCKDSLDCREIFEYNLENILDKP